MSARYETGHVETEEILGGWRRGEHRPASLYLDACPHADE